MRFVVSLVAMVPLLTSTTELSWGQNRGPATQVVHGDSWSAGLTVFEDEPSTVRFDHPIVSATSTNPESWKLEIDQATGLLTVTFIGTGTASIGTIRVVTTRTVCVIRVQATNDEQESDPLKHFKRARPPGLSSTHPAVSPIGTMPPMGTPRPPIPSAHDAARAAAELSPAPHDGPRDIGRDRRSPRTEAVTYHIKAMAGVLWAENSVARDQRAAAPMTGLGLEVRKGYTPSVAVDGELLVASSGEAVFHDTDSTGPLVQTTRLARLGAGARLRLGDRRIPFVRVGLGLEGSWSQLQTPAAGTWLAPELAWALQLTLALGFDLALGDHTLAGAELSATGRRSIAGTLHIGYGP